MYFDFGEAVQENFAGFAENWVAHLHVFFSRLEVIEFNSHDVCVLFIFDGRIVD